MARFDTIAPTPEDIAGAERFFRSDESAVKPILELMTWEELGDLWRTFNGTDPTEWEHEIDHHPFASDSRKAKFRIALWMWSGHVRLYWQDPHRFDPANRAKFIRAMRVFVGLSPIEAASMGPHPAYTVKGPHPACTVKGPHGPHEIVLQYIDVGVGGRGIPELSDCPGSEE